MNFLSFYFFTILIICLIIIFSIVLYSRKNEEDVIVDPTNVELYVRIISTLSLLNLFIRELELVIDDQREISLVSQIDNNVSQIEESLNQFFFIHIQHSIQEQMTDKIFTMATYPGEIHMILSSGQTAQFIGSGTRTKKRLEMGQTGLTLIDTCAVLHDIDYDFCTTFREEKLADGLFVRRINFINDRKLDTDFNYKITYAFINLKIRSNIRLTSSTKKPKKLLDFYRTKIPEIKRILRNKGIQM